MPAMIELRTTQKRMLFMLMKLERDNPGIKIAGLRDQIIAFQTEMEQEDVALVEKNDSRNLN
jgi:hypothetical protein